jgi:8-oxo-dGTP pyrophosphatase MutT (NUDIX family)
VGFRVTDPLPVFDGVELLAPARLRLVAAAAPVLTATEQAALDARWDEAVRVKPSLFDGPVAACGGLLVDEPEAGTCTVTWLRATYRRYIPDREVGSALWLPHLFVSVLQPTDDGSLLVGRMAAWTASAGTWQLPSGTGEPPPVPGDPLEVADLRALAARELREEIGADTAAAELTLWRLNRGSQGDVGVLFLAPSQPEHVLRARYDRLAAAERAAGGAPEFDRIAFVRAEADLAALGDPRADLSPIVRTFGLVTRV